MKWSDPIAIYGPCTRIGRDYFPGDRPEGPEEVGESVGSDSLEQRHLD